MGARIDVPDHVDQVFDKPGERWQPEERQQVKGWLCEQQPLNYLRAWVKFSLGYSTDEKVTEELNNFWAERLDKVIEIYDPNRGRRFWSHLLFRLQKFCLDQRRKDGRDDRRKAPMSVSIDPATGEPKEEEVLDPDEQTDPQVAFERQEMRLRVRRCVAALPPPYRTIITLFYFENQSVNAIANTLGYSVSNVKQVLRRGRLMVLACIQAMLEADGDTS